MCGTSIALGDDVFRLDDSFLTRLSAGAKKLPHDGVLGEQFVIPMLDQEGEENSCKRRENGDLDSHKASLAD